MATLIEVTKILTGAIATKPDFKMTVSIESFVAAWHRHVEHLPADQLQAAVDRAVRGTQYFPSVHEVLKAAGQLAAGEGMTALEAWAKVKWAMRVYGNYHPPKPGPYPLMVNNREWEFDDPRTAAAVAGLGWANLFDGEEDVMRSHFVRAYDAMALRDMQRALELPGSQAPKELTP